MRWVLRKEGKAARTRFQKERELVLSHLRRRLKRMRVKVVPRPRTENGKGWLDPQLPADITVLADERLGRLQGEFAAMAQYSQFQLALRSIEFAIAKRGDKFTRARVRLEKTGTNPDKDAKVEVDTRTRALSFELLMGESEARLTEAVLEGFVIGRDLCSREQSRRATVYK